MRVLSLFDGISCGMLAFLSLGIVPERYVAYETDKFCIQTSQHNFTCIEREENGDVFDADYTKYAGFDWLVGGSPCTYWSVAQSKDKRETTASGKGWELFSQYVRALKEAKPKYFLYENNKSMSKDIRKSIDDAFGIEGICINSALVSAQNRQRIYWCGIRQEDGTYREAHIEQPEDRGILLKDILDNAVAWRDKSYCIDAHYGSGGSYSDLKNQSGRRLMAAEPFNPTTDGKSHTITATYYKISSTPISDFGEERNRQRVAEPVAMRQVGRRINEDGHREDGNKDIECD